MHDWKRIAESALTTRYRKFIKSKFCESINKFRCRSSKEANHTLSFLHFSILLPVYDYWYTIILEL